MERWPQRPFIIGSPSCGQEKISVNCANWIMPRESWRFGRREAWRKRNPLAQYTPLHVSIIGTRLFVWPAMISCWGKTTLKNIQLRLSINSEVFCTWIERGNLQGKVWKCQKIRALFPQNNNTKHQKPFARKQQRPWLDVFAPTQLPFHLPET